MLHEPTLRLQGRRRRATTPTATCTRCASCSAWRPRPRPDDERARRRRSRPSSRAAARAPGDRASAPAAARWRSRRPGWWPTLLDGDVELVPITTSGRPPAATAAAGRAGQGALRQGDRGGAAGAARSTWPCTRPRTCPRSCPTGWRSSACRSGPTRATPSAAPRRSPSCPRARCVGTSSLRRRSQLLALRPDLDVRELRGNVDTRLRKLADGDYDALVLAAAGLDRLGRARGRAAGRADAPRRGPGLPGAGGARRRRGDRGERAAARHRPPARSWRSPPSARWSTRLERQLPHARGRARASCDGERAPAWPPSPACPTARAGSATRSTAIADGSGGAGSRGGRAHAGRGRRASVLRGAPEPVAPR